MAIDRHGFMGRLDDDDKQYDTERRFKCQALCTLCGGAVMQKIVIPKTQREGKRTYVLPELPIEVIEQEMFNRLLENHECPKRLVSPSGQRIGKA